MYYKKNMIYQNLKRKLMNYFIFIKYFFIKHLDEDIY